MIMTTPARPGSGAGRRRPSQDLTLSGPLLTRLYLTAGAGVVLHGVLSASGSGRWWELGVGVAALGFSGVGFRLTWSDVPAAAGRAFPLIAIALNTLMGLFGSHDAIIPVVLGLALIAVWTGIGLESVDLVTTSLVLAASLVAVSWHSVGPAIALPQALSASVLLIGLGYAMHLLRAQLDVTADRASSARQGVADAAMAAQRQREQQESERADATRAELARRADLQAQVAAQVGTLAGAASGVSNQAGAVSAAVDEMSHALQELTRTAQISDQISESVAAKAREASEVMAALAESSAQIMAASDVIQGIAEQTNLLALNATIESARAGEAGHGFAVVANEVKDLARQSGDNADTITRTLAEVRSQVDAAVSRVAEISASMDELNRQNGTLAAAIEEQSAVVQQIAESVGSTATEADRMAEGVRSLERIAAG